MPAEHCINLSLKKKMKGGRRSNEESECAAGMGSREMRERGVYRGDRPKVSV